VTLHHILSVSLFLSLPPSLLILTAIFPGGPELAGTTVSILYFIGAKDNGDGGDNWSYKMWKLQSTHHHQQPNGQLFTIHMTVSKHLREKYHVPRTCSSQPHLHRN